MLENRDYCDYETCVTLKELGFNEKCHGHYEPLKKCFNTTSIKRCWCNSEVDDIGVIICPTLYEAQKWLREEKGIIVGIINNFTTHEFDFYVSTWDENKCRGNKYSSYEDALQRGIKEAVKILKEK